MFGGHTNITEVATSRGLRCGQVVDELYGFDLRDPTQRAWLDGYLHTSRPRLVTVEFPCKYWGRYTALNFCTPERKQLLRRLRARERPFLQLVEDTFRNQLAHKSHALSENPWLSSTWDEELLRRVVAMPGVIAFRTHMCQHGLVHAKTKGPVKKDTKLVATPLP